MTVIQQTTSLVMQLLTVLFSVMSTNLSPILILIFIPSLEELKDLNDKPELMQSFVSKDESVSY